MSMFPKDRIEKAKRRLREKLTFEKVRSNPKYRNLTRDQYDKYMDKLFNLALLLLESYVKSENRQV